MATKRPKLLSAGLRQAGVKSRAKRQKIRERVAAGKPSGLKAAGVTRRGDRRIIKENIAAATATRTRRRASDRAAGQTERRVRRRLPQGIRGSRRTGGGR